MPEIDLEGRVDALERRVDSHDGDIAALKAGQQEILDHQHRLEGMIDHSFNTLAPQMLNSVPAGFVWKLLIGACVFAIAIVAAAWIMR